MPGQIYVNAPTVKNNMQIFAYAVQSEISTLIKILDVNGNVNASNRAQEALDAVNGIAQVYFPAYEPHWDKDDLVEIITDAWAGISANTPEEKALEVAKEIWEKVQVEVGFQVFYNRHEKALVEAAGVVAAGGNADAAYGPLAEDLGLIEELDFSGKSGAEALKQDLKCSAGTNAQKAEAVAEKWYFELKSGREQKAKAAVKTAVQAIYNNKENDVDELEAALNTTKALVAGKSDADIGYNITNLAELIEDELSGAKNWLGYANVDTVTDKVFAELTGIIAVKTKPQEMVQPAQDIKANAKAHLLNYVIAHEKSGADEAFKAQVRNVTLGAICAMRGHEVPKKAKFTEETTTKFVESFMIFAAGKGNQYGEITDKLFEDLCSDKGMDIKYKVGEEVTNVQVEAKRAAKAADADKGDADNRKNPLSGKALRGAAKRDGQANFDGSESDAERQAKEDAERKAKENDGKSKQGTKRKRDEISNNDAVVRTDLPKVDNAKKPQSQGRVMPKGMVKRPAPQQNNNLFACLKSAGDTLWSHKWSILTAAAVGVAIGMELNSGGRNTKSAISAMTVFKDEVLANISKVFAKITPDFVAKFANKAYEAVAGIAR